MTTSEVLELAAENLEQARIVREWVRDTEIPPDMRFDVEQSAIDAELKARGNFQAVLTRLMRRGS